MSRAAIRSALQAALNSIQPPISTAWENTSFNPVNGIPYQKVDLLFAQPDNSEFGSNYMELGILQVTLMYPLSMGTFDMENRIDLLTKKFKRGASFSSGNQTVIINSSPWATGGVRDGDRWAAPVKIRWQTNVSI